MSEQTELKPCPFCGSVAEAHTDPSEKTLEEAMAATKIVNCSKVYCIARHVCATPEQWNTRLPAPASPLKGASNG